jgi:4-amino-4-deoxy-L-arabinose transferase-like glycosyltransferase
VRLTFIIVLALAPLWLVGLFGRQLWTPDEPREADIAWRMSQQSDRSLPQLAGSPFLEKPPLSYWMAAAGIALFGDSAAGARAPLLLCALLTALALAALARGMGLGTSAALVAALVAGSALSLYRVSSWLAPDAALLAGNALALLGVWRGYTAAPGRAKAWGYALMHAGAAIGFMAKSAPGWLVPGLVFAGLILWERRWPELRRWELYAGFLLQVLIIGPWLWTVALGAHGAEALSVLFWNNLAGRFAHIDAPAALNYSAGHPNHFGKYFIELPFYLLPWTLICAAGLVRACRHCREAAPAGTAWRFALLASVPFLVLLSLAATARDIYAAPALLGFALLAALWLQDTQAAPRPLDGACLTGTQGLIALIALLLAGGLAVLVLAGEAAGAPALATIAAILVFAVLALAAARRAQRRGDFSGSVVYSYGAYAAAVTLSAFIAFPVIDRGQDLRALADAVRSDTQQQPLALLAPDETTLAIMDHGHAGSFTVLDDNEPATVRGWFDARGPRARVLVLLPGHAAGPLTQWLARWLTLAEPGNGVAAELVNGGAASLLRLYELPQGRRYALLGPPQH